MIPKNLIADLTYYILENINIDSQFTLNKIKEVFSGEVPDYRTIKSRLPGNYGSDIQCHMVKKYMVFLHKGNTTTKILCKEWYGNR